MKAHHIETTQLAIRFPVALVERLDAYTARSQAHLNRSDAIRSLLLDALDRAEARERAKERANEKESA